METNERAVKEAPAHVDAGDAQELPSLGEFWDALATFPFNVKQEEGNIMRFFELDAIAQRSSRHEHLMSQFWDAAFDGVPRPARPNS
jgi:hypothetical protein